MDKRHLHHIYRQVRSLNWMVFFVLAVAFMAVHILAVRQNDLKMIELRDGVIAADKQDGDIEGALRSLREHVYTHMRMDLTPREDSIHPPIQLKHEYERLVKAERDRVRSANEKIYSDAQAYCEARFPVGLSGSGRIPCIEEYVTANGVRENPVPDALYKFDFISPRWSPDLAGWALVLGCVFAALAAAKFVLDRWLRHQLGI